MEIIGRKCIFAAMQTAAHALTQQFLAWVEEAPRSYADAEAWRRSCPHFSIWEDAISDGLVRFENGSSMQGIAAGAHAARAGAAQARLITPRAAPAASFRPYPLRLDGHRPLRHTRTNSEQERGAACPRGPDFFASPEA